MRLGTSLTLNENIYTVAFMAELNNEEIDAVTQEDGGRPPQPKDVRMTPKGTVIGFSDDFDENDPSFLEGEAEMIRWENRTMKRYETYKMERTKLNVHIFVCIFSQMILIVMLFDDSWSSFDLRETVMGNTDMSLLTAKGICSIILHLCMFKTVVQGCEMMKYALNH